MRKYILESYIYITANGRYSYKNKLVPRISLHENVVNQDLQHSGSTREAQVATTSTLTTP